MRNLAEFQIIGRVGRITPHDGATRVSVCANYRYQDGDTRRDDPHWNEIVVFNRHLRETVARQLSVGDLVHARGRIRQSRFQDQATGEQRFSTDLVALDLGALVASKGTSDE